MTAAENTAETDTQLQFRVVFGDQMLFCGRSRNSRWLRSRNSAVGGSVLMFYSLSPFVVTLARPGRLLGL
jgi:hypothetical protein